MLAAGGSKADPSTPDSQQSVRRFDFLVGFLFPLSPIPLPHLSGSCNVEKSFIVDVITKLYIATDSTPVDAHTYELCSDLLDVVMDISSIYTKSDNAKTSYDDRSTSAIRLNTGMVLYLRHVSDYLALVCIMHAESFAKRSLLDYNIDVFRESLQELISHKQRR